MKELDKDTALALNAISRDKKTKHYEIDTMTLARAEIALSKLSKKERNKKFEVVVIESFMIAQCKDATQCKNIEIKKQLEKIKQIKSIKRYNRELEELYAKCYTQHCENCEIDFHS
jgi:archaellum biogenesis ATPase FlaH